MAFQLHDRRGSAPRGLVCDEHGLHFAGECALVEPADDGGYRRRPTADINRALSAGFGAAIDLEPREAVLDQIAGCLAKGEIGRAQLLALHLRLPELEDDGQVERLLKADRLLRFNPNHDERGRFASAPGDGGGRDAKYPNRTAAGIRYSTALHLSAAQSKTLSDIVDYGVKHDYRTDQIAIVVNQAFYESSLGTLEHNPRTPKPVGLFQYEAPEWKDHHAELDLHSDADQIVAMFKDIGRYEAQYVSGQASGSIPKAVFFSEYMALMHHAGPHGQETHHLGVDPAKWKADKYVVDYNKKSSALDFEL